MADKVPILLEVTHRVTHCVSILALDERLFRRVLKVVLTPVQVGIHRAYDVGEVIALSTLVVDWARWVEVANPAVASLEVLAEACLVTHTPDDD